MSRVIALRIYDKQNKRMLYAYEPNEQGKREYIPFEFGIGFSHWDKAWLSEPMLFTGKHDSKWKDIWEGDILRIEDTRIGWVIYDEIDGAFRIQGYDFWQYLFQSAELEVIGNLHENSELAA